jgi:glycosyltransferase involved in cell wall biosynthesis
VSAGISNTCGGWSIGGCGTDDPDLGELVLEHRQFPTRRHPGAERPRAMEQADCIVLPSYREGLPRALREGSAMSKPLIATDVPHCRDVVEDGNTGYLCAERSADSLAAAMVKIIDASDTERLRMGELGRRKIEQELGETRVIDKYLDALGS